MSKVVSTTKDFIVVTTKYRDEGVWASYEVLYDDIPVFSYDEYGVFLCRLEDDEIKALLKKGVHLTGRYISLDRIDEELE